MTSDAAALQVAIDLLHVPSRSRPMRSAPLPHGVPMLLEIAAGDAETAQRAANLLGRPPELVRNAAAFFVEQVLFAPDADSYRVLGAGPQASAAELRRNMALLLKWLHPDMERNANGDSDRSMFAGRVTHAWEDLKTPERRAAYDAAHHARSTQKPGRRSKSGARSKSNGRGAGPRPPPRGFWRALLSLLGGVRH